MTSTIGSVAAKTQEPVAEPNVPETDHITIPHSTPRYDEPRASLLGLLNVLLRRRWTVIVAMVVTLGLVGAVTLLRARTYTATAAFVPHVRQPTGTLQGLASQFGIGVNAGGSTQSPQFYVELIQSREILRNVAEHRYEFTSDSGKVVGTLAEILKPAGESEAEQHEAVLRRLHRIVAATQTQQTGIVRVSVTTPYRELSALMLDHLLAEMNEFNLQTRQSEVGAERRFLEQRLSEARTDLRAAEDRLQSFLQRNREFGASSALSVERERLQRDVSTYRDIYTEIAQNYERARMEEVRDTPVITVLERPEAPVLPDPRGLLRNGLIALAAGLVLGTALAFAAEYMSHVRREESSEYERFVRLRGESMRDLTHPWEGLARLVRRRDQG